MGLRFAAALVHLIPLFVGLPLTGQKLRWNDYAFLVYENLLHVH